MGFPGFLYQHKYSCFLPLSNIKERLCVGIRENSTKFSNESNSLLERICLETTVNISRLIAKKKCYTTMAEDVFTSQKHTLSLSIAKMKGGQLLSERTSFVSQCNVYNRIQRFEIAFVDFKSAEKLYLVDSTCHLEPVFETTRRKKTEILNLFSKFHVCPTFFLSFPCCDVSLLKIDCFVIRCPGGESHFKFLYCIVWIPLVPLLSGGPSSYHNYDVEHLLWISLCSLNIHSFALSFRTSVFFWVPYLFEI